MNKHFINITLAILLILSILFGWQAVQSQPSQITTGLNYLKSRQNPDGSWGGTATSLNGVFPTTATTLEALRAVEGSTSTNQTSAIQFLSAQTVDVNPFLAARIAAFAGTGSNTTADLNALLAAQNADGGWGTADVFQSDNLDTSFAILALSTGRPNISVMYQAVFYLINRQNADGGWSLTQGEDSQVYYTAMALQAMNSARLQYATSFSQNRAISYLRSKQNPDGGYGSPASTAFETAATLIAIIGTGQQTTNAEANATNYLNNTQQANGSWVDDAYSTALALRALTFQPAPPVDRVPVINSQPVKTAREGQLYSYQVQASDPDNLALSYSLLRAPTGMNISATGLIQWTPTAGQAGNSVVIIQVANSNGATAIQEYSVTVLAVGVDLTVASVDASAVTTDPNTLVATGNVHVQIGNQGGSLFSGSFTVLLFEDRNGNGTYESAIDNALGAGTFSGNIDSLGSSPLDVGVSGVVQFRDNLIYAFADSANQIPELDETNNYGHSGLASTYQPPVGDFQPKVKWQYEFAGASGVEHPPLVAPLIDTNGDGLINERDVPAVIFVTGFLDGNATTLDAPVALRGDTGAVIFNGTRSGFRQLDSSFTTPAVGDIDGDGKPEIIVNAAYFESPHHVYCFNNDGTLKWTSPPLANLEYSPVIADLDGDGKAEIVGGGYCLNFDGTLRWDRHDQVPIYRGGFYSNASAIVADLDLDGKQEVVLGPKALDKDGNIIWSWTSSLNSNNTTFTLTGKLDRGATTISLQSDSPLGESYTAIANLDADPYPEIISVQSSVGSNPVHSAWILEHDGRIKAGPIHLYQGITNQVIFHLGPPTVADFDGDGQPEIAIPFFRQPQTVQSVNDHRQYSLAVYKFRNDTLELQWQKDFISNSNDISPATVSAFDFDGDGAQEPVYLDSQKLYILDGSTGATRFEMGVERTNGDDADHRYPTVADVDNDGVAEIIVPTRSSTKAGSPTRHGVFVLGDTKGNWRSARRTWNQWAYNITNINENASISPAPKPSWQVFNSFRAQSAADGAARFAAPDLTVSKVTVNAQGCPASAGLTARIGNGGSLHAGAGLPVNFYLGDPSSGGVLIGTRKTTKLIMPGEFEDVTLAWNAPAAGRIFVTVNDPPTSNLVGSSNLSRLPNAWAQTSGFQTSGFVVFNNGAFFGIDGQTNTFWSDQGTLSTGPHFFEVRFPFPVNTSSVTIQNAGSSTTGFLAGTLSFSNGFTQAMTLNASGEGTVAFAEQQNVTWIRLTASSTKANGASLSEFIAAGNYIDPPFRINEGTGKLNNNKAASSFNVSPCDAAGNKPPQITSGPPITAQIGSAYSYQVQATDPNSDPLTFSLVTAPAGMTMNLSGLVNWTPANTQTGDAQVIVQASDGRGGVAQQSFTINVPAPPSANRDPQITSAASASVVLGQTYQYNVNALDPDGDTVIFALLQSPPGANIGQFSGSISWVPSAAQLGIQFFSVEAQDGKGGRAIQSFAVDVLEPSAPTTLPPNTVNCSLTTDKRSYAANDSAQMSVTAQNRSATLDISGLHAQVTVTDPNSQSIFNATLPVNPLAPNALFKGVSPFDAGTRPPGAYRASLDLRYGQQSVCTAQANFNILPSDAQGVALAGMITSTPAVVERPGSAIINYQVSNIGNVDLSGLDLKVLLVDIATGNAVQSFSDQTSLNRGQAFSNNKSLSSTAVAAGDYLLVLQGTTGGTTQTIGSASLRINKSTFHLDAAGYTVTEGCSAAIITVTRTGDASDSATVDFSSSDGIADQRTDYSIASGTLNFGSGETSQTFKVLVNEDGYAEGNETLTINLTNATNGTGVGTDGSATLTIIDNDVAASTTNPIDDAGMFVCQHYHDFLAREADEGGAAYWTSQITQCGNDPICIRNKRIDVSNAFYYELEFQQTGSYVYRLYRAAFGNNQPFPNPNPDPANPGEEKKVPLYLPFMRDRARVRGGSQLAQLQLDRANAFVHRSEFLAKYPANLDGPAFVDAVLATIQNDIGVNLTSQRAALITLFNSDGRGAVIFRLADDNGQTNPIDNRAFIDAEYNRAFVFTQYAGYLRRNPDMAGFLFWLGQVNSVPLRDVPKQHAMVCSFITSAEYQQRFSSMVTHFNSECPQ